MLAPRCERCGCLLTATPRPDFERKLAEADASRDAERFLQRPAIRAVRVGSAALIVVLAALAGFLHGGAVPGLIFFTIAALLTLPLTFSPRSGRR